MDKLDDKRNKDARLHLRLYRHEHRALQLLAARENLSMSEYLMRYVRQQAKEKEIPI